MSSQELSTKLAEALRTIESLRDLLKAEELESSLQHVRADEADFNLEELRNTIETLHQQVDTLIKALTAVRYMDSAGWVRKDLLHNPWMHIVFVVLPSGLLRVQGWSPLSDRIGSRYLIVRAEGGYELLEADTNEKDI